MNEQLVHAATWVNFHKNYAERSHTKESTYYVILFFFLILENANKSNDRKQIHGCVGWGVGRSKERWTIWGNDRNVH